MRRGALVVLSMMEGMLPEYELVSCASRPDHRDPTAAPSNAYPTADGKWILIAANSDPLFGKLTALMGQPELARDPRFAGNRARLQERRRARPGSSRTWTRQLAAAEVDRRLSEADIPCTQVYTAAECAADPQFRHRGMVREVGRCSAGDPPHRHRAPRARRSGCRALAGPAGRRARTVLRELLGLPPAGDRGRQQEKGDLMDKSNGQAVEIVEIGARDGFQAIGPFIPTETKIRLLERLVAAGVRRVEIGSFVSAKAVPQLRDTAEVLTAAARRCRRSWRPRCCCPASGAAARRWRRVPSISCSWCR